MNGAGSGERPPNVARYLLRLKRAWAIVGPRKLSRPIPRCLRMGQFLSAFVPIASSVITSLEIPLTATLALADDCRPRTCR